MKENSWIILAFIGLVVILSIKHCKAELPQGAMLTPSIEFSCKGLRDVALYDNGALTINNKSFSFRGGVGETTLQFDNKVTLTGIKSGDNLMLNDATIIYEGKRYKCRAQ